MIETLTGLRGLAVLMVVAAGLAATGILPSEFGSGLDQLGLMLVVVLAGVLAAGRMSGHPHARWDHDGIQVSP